MRILRSTVSRLGPRGGSLKLGLLIGMTLSAVATGARRRPSSRRGSSPRTTRPARSRVNRDGSAPSEPSRRAPYSLASRRSVLTPRASTASRSTNLPCPLRGKALSWRSSMSSSLGRSTVMRVGSRLDSLALMGCFLRKYQSKTGLLNSVSARDLSAPFLFRLARGTIIR
jgi:hypothetical protein